MILLYILLGIIIVLVIYKMLFENKKQLHNNNCPPCPECPACSTGPVKPTPDKPTPDKPTPVKPTPVKPTPVKPTDSSEWTKYAGCCVITNQNTTTCHVDRNDTCPWTKDSVGHDVVFEDPKVCTTLGLGSNNEVKMKLSNLMSSSKLESLSPKKLRAALLKSVVWPENKKVITVGFIRDNNYSERKAKWVQESVEKYIVNGGIDKNGNPTRLIRLNFQWDYQPVYNADIRITFDPSKGAYSALGSGSLSFPRNECTMNLGWLDTVDEISGRKESKGKATVVIHEFGHALGMIHEHNRQDAALPWNCDAVRNWLRGPPNSWCDEQIDSNVFSPVPMMQLDASEYDAKSIMHYYFPPNFFIPNVKMPYNTELSYLDKIWLAKTYPTGEDINNLVQKQESKKGKQSYSLLIIVTIIVLILIIGFILRIVSGRKEVMVQSQVSSYPPVPPPTPVVLPTYVPPSTQVVLPTYVPPPTPVV